jgi:hypothetical protein
VVALGEKGRCYELALKVILDEPGGMRDAE